MESTNKSKNSINKDLPVLVVGGAGYIGSHVVNKLLENNYKVRILDKFVFGKKIIADLLKNKNLEVIEGDISDLFVLTRAMTGVSAVVHLAGLVGDPACAVDEEMTIHMNIASTKIVKEITKAFGVPRFVFASSCSVYGSSDEVMTEESGLNPVSLYAKTKIDSEQEILGDLTKDFNPTVLRFATVFGHSRRPRFDLVVNLFTAQAYNHGLVTVTGSKQWRPFVHVADIARSIYSVLEAPLNTVERQIFNVGDDSLNITIGDLAELVAKVVKKDQKGNDIEIFVKDDVEDRRNYIVSFEKIKKSLNFVSLINLEKGIAEMAENFRKNVYKEHYKSPTYINVEMTKLLQQEFYSEKYKKNNFSLIGSESKILAS